MCDDAACLCPQDPLEVERLRLAACLIAAEGGDVTKMRAKYDSASLRAVLELRARVASHESAPTPAPTPVVWDCAMHPDGTIRGQCRGPMPCDYPDCPILPPATPPAPTPEPASPADEVGVELPESLWDAARDPLVVMRQSELDARIAAERALARIGAIAVLELNSNRTARWWDRVMDAAIAHTEDAATYDDRMARARELAQEVNGE